MWIRGIIAGILLFAILGACQQQAEVSNEKQHTALHVKYEEKVHTKENETVQKVREIILPMKQVRKMKVGAYDKDIIAVLELRHLYTFRSEKIIKEAKEKIKKEYPKRKVKVTTDHKIYIELEKLEAKIKNNDLSEEELKKEMKKIKKLLKQT